ncbi:helix-turn-helix domain-containing protein [Aquipuribacter hungaricus]|uniref:Helix-turn-helix domain-containing protein n=1 Tax=Aquipuribacter hungaricus TaxID=545624 RepID=A0ABV7WBX5_9MICO
MRKTLELSPLLLTPEEVAHILRVGRSRVYDLMRSHRLISVKIGGSRRVPIVAVQQYIDDLVSGEAS